MITIKKLGLLIFLSAFVFAQNEEVCTFDDSGADCSQLPIEENYNVCGFYTSFVKCDDGFCFKNYSSKCEACQDIDVESVIRGDCPKEPNREPLSKEIEDYYCAENERDKDCDLNSIEDFVCGYDINDKIIDTFLSTCTACLNKEVYRVSFHECNSKANLAYTCRDEDKAENKYCSLISDKEVCGYKKGVQECKSSKTEECYKQYPNKCFACKDKDVKYTFEGDCKKSIYECTEADRNSRVNCNITAEEDSLVCAHSYSNCIGENCTKTMQSKCHACQDKNIFFIEEGSCEADLKEGRAENKPVEEKPVLHGSSCSILEKNNEICEDKEEKVCALKNFGDNTFRMVQYKNRCEACKDEVDSILSSGCDAVTPILLDQ